MRISDWSSDVCSSDLICGETSRASMSAISSISSNPSRPSRSTLLTKVMIGTERKRQTSNSLRVCGSIPLAASITITAESTDRKSVVEGKSVSVRVDLGGRRLINKKKNKRYKQK